MRKPLALIAAASLALAGAALVGCQQGHGGSNMGSGHATDSGTGAQQSSGTGDGATGSGRMSNDLKSTDPGRSTGHGTDSGTGAQQTSGTGGGATGSRDPGPVDRGTDTGRTTESGTGAQQTSGKDDPKR